ncbi:arginine--tRNA ligase, partial [Candidatus Micrarchaeota archaeon]|nr:arginine--tRNA ligase [Candidatus Micrarchaeota archaeon]
GGGKKKKKKVMVEFPSVNPNKPWHIGHLRNALLGNAIANIIEFHGYSVERTDYIDDLGLQVAQSLWGYLNLKEEPKGKFDHWLGEKYVEVAEKIENDENIKNQVYEILHRMEKWDSEMSKKARWLAEECVKYQYQTAFDYGIYHDALIFESDIMREIFQEGLELLKKNKAIKYEKTGENKGCWVVKLKGEFSNLKNPDKILIRSNGTATYTGKDAIFHLWKFGKLKRNFKYAEFLKQPDGKMAYKTSESGKKMNFGNADMIVNVIGAEQTYPQKVVVEVLKRLNYILEAENYIHIGYEHAELPEEKFSGRKGTWKGYTADKLLEESKKKVKKKIKEGYSAEERENISEAVGEGAIKFSFLRTSPDKKLVFKWEEALNLEGDSGPYLQYSYVRCRSILEKGGSEGDAAEGHSFSSEEKKLVNLINRFPDVVEKSAKTFRPHIIIDYLLDVSSAFSSFYAANRVLGMDEKTTQSRLALVHGTSVVLKNGINLLGIKTPEYM